MTLLEGLSNSFLERKFLFSCDYLLTFCNNFESVLSKCNSHSILDVILENLIEKWNRLNAAFENVMLSSEYAANSQLKKIARANFNICADSYYECNAKILDLLKFPKVQGNLDIKHLPIPIVVPQSLEIVEISPLPIASREQVAISDTTKDESIACNVSHSAGNSFTSSCSDSSAVQTHRFWRGSLSHAYYSVRRKIAPKLLGFLKPITSAPNTKFLPKKGFSKRIFLNSLMIYSFLRSSRPAYHFSLRWMLKSFLKRYKWREKLTKHLFPFAQRSIYIAKWKTLIYFSICYFYRFVES